MDMSTVVRLNEHKDPVWQARVDLAACHRLHALNGFDDGIWNHLTLMVPGTKDCFFVKPHGILMSEVTASSLIVANFDGKIVEGRGEIETTAYCIHAQFHKMHPKGTAVLHSHPYYATWLCMTEPGRLLPIHQDFMVYLNSVAYDDNFEGQGSTLEEGARMAKACGDKTILVSANHGLSTVNETIAEAWYDFYYFERACKAQHSIMMTNQKPRLVGEQIVQFTRSQQVDGGRRKAAALLNYEAMKRRLDREQPDYKT